MKRCTAVAPQSGREVWALVLFALMVWVGVSLTVMGVAGLSDTHVVVLGGAGALVILCTGLAWARQFRRR